MQMHRSKKTILSGFNLHVGISPYRPSRPSPSHTDGGRTGSKNEQGVRRMYPGGPQVTDVLIQLDPKGSLAEIRGLGKPSAALATSGGHSTQVRIDPQANGSSVSPLRSAQGGLLPTGLLKGGRPLPKSEVQRTFPERVGHSASIVTGPTAASAGLYPQGISEKNFRNQRQGDEGGIPGGQLPTGHLGIAVKTKFEKFFVSTNPGVPMAQGQAMPGVARPNGSQSLGGSSFLKNLGLNSREGLPSGNTANKYLLKGIRGLANFRIKKIGERLGYTGYLGYPGGISNAKLRDWADEYLTSPIALSKSQTVGLKDLQLDQDTSTFRLKNSGHPSDSLTSEGHRGPSGQKPLLRTGGCVAIRTAVMTQTQSNKRRAELLQRYIAELKKITPTSAGSSSRLWAPGDVGPLGNRGSYGSEVGGHVAVAVIDKILLEKEKEAINRQIKLLGTHRGQRYLLGLPVRGQRTRSNAKTASKKLYAQ